MCIVVTVCGQSYMDHYLVTDSAGRVLDYTTHEEADEAFKSFNVTSMGMALLYPKSCYTDKYQLQLLLPFEKELFRVETENLILFAIKIPNRLADTLRDLLNSACIGVKWTSSNFLG